VAAMKLDVKGGELAVLKGTESCYGDLGYSSSWKLRSQRRWHL
jgi:hypothetical protein